METSQSFYLQRTRLCSTAKEKQLLTAVRRRRRRQPRATPRDRRFAGNGAAELGPPRGGREGFEDQKVIEATWRHTHGTANSRRIPFALFPGAAYEPAFLLLELMESAIRPFSEKQGQSPILTIFRDLAKLPIPPFLLTKLNKTDKRLFDPQNPKTMQIAESESAREKWLSPKTGLRDDLPQTAEARYGAPRETHAGDADSAPLTP
jgi:hypothetical protein